VGVQEARHEMTDDNGKIREVKPGDELWLRLSDNTLRLCRVEAIEKDMPDFQTLVLIPRDEEGELKPRRRERIGRFKSHGDRKGPAWNLFWQFEDAADWCDRATRSKVMGLLKQLKAARASREKSLNNLHTWRAVRKQG